MAFKFTNSKGKAYYLHANVRKLKSGKTQQLFYFAQTVKDGSLDAVPQGMGHRDPQRAAGVAPHQIDIASNFE
jgi:hypothetical protein